MERKFAGSGPSESSLLQGSNLRTADLLRGKELNKNVSVIIFMREIRFTKHAEQEEPQILQAQSLFKPYKNEREHCVASKQSVGSIVGVQTAVKNAENCIHRIYPSNAGFGGSAWANWGSDSLKLAGKRGCCACFWYHIRALRHVRFVGAL